MINPRNLLSDEERMQLQAHGQDSDKLSWYAGYLGARRKKEIRAKKLEMPIMMLYKEMASECSKSADTIRGYVYVCERVPKKTYRKWGEHFSFSQFRRLVPVCGTEHNAYVDRLTEWIAYCDKHHIKPTNVDGITRFLNKDKNKEPQERKWYRQAIKYLEKLEASPNVPTPIRQLIMHFTAKLSKMEWE